MDGSASDAQAFYDARDVLWAHRDDYEGACRAFAWPRIERFNWALDHFDDLARDNHAPALWIVAEGSGNEQRFSFEQMRRQIDTNPAQVRVYIAGGAAADLAPRLSPPVEVVDNLVLEGVLALAGVTAPV